jgi:hypothetical protein
VVVAVGNEELEEVILIPFGALDDEDAFIDERRELGASLLEAWILVSGS